MHKIVPYFPGLSQAKGVSVLSTTFDSARMILMGLDKLALDYWVAVKGKSG